MEDTINQLQSWFPKLTFRPGKTFYWSPRAQEIRYVIDAKKPAAIWSLLHETGHAALEHTAYTTDYELLRLEVAAWEQAKLLAQELRLDIDENHIQDCLDTYRDWIYARSICPRCDSKCVQLSNIPYYRCFNCHASWKVTTSRFCRPYRALQKSSSRPTTDQLQQLPASFIH